MVNTESKGIIDQWTGLLTDEQTSIILEAYRKGVVEVGGEYDEITATALLRWSDSTLLRQGILQNILEGYCGFTDFDEEQGGPIAIGLRRANK